MELLDRESYHELQLRIFNTAIKNKHCTNVLLDEVRVNIFKDELSVIYDILDRFEYIDDMVLNDSLDMNQGAVVNSKYAQGFEGLKELEFQEKYTVLKNGILEGYKAVLEVEPSEEDADLEKFRAQIKLLKDRYTEEYYQQTILHLGMIMSPQGMYDSSPRVRRQIQGFDAAEEYRFRRMDHINEVNAVDKAFEHIVLDEKQLPKSQEGKHIGRVISEFGVPDIDQHMNGIRGGNLVAIIGAPKGGKTSTLIHLVTQALRRKENVLVWLTEAEWYEWEAGLIASLYLNDLKKSGEFILNDQRSELCSTTVLNNTPKYAGTIALLRARLYTDPELGRLQFIKGDAIAEEFISVLKSKEKSHPFTFLAFDTPVLAVSEHMDKYIAIGYVIKALKSYLSNHRRGKCAGVMSAQFKQSMIDFIRRNPDKEVPIESGGDSAEVARTPDYVWGVFANEAERTANRQTFYGMGSRHTQLPKRIDVGMDYGAKYLYSLQDI